MNEKLELMEKYINRLKEALEKTEYLFVLGGNDGYEYKYFKPKN